MQDSADYQKTARWSFIEVVFWSLMIGAGESYIAVFAISLGFSEAYVGFLMVVPLALASALQLVSPYFIKYFKTRQNFVVFFSLIQALTLLLLNLVPREKETLHLGLFIIMTSYWFLSLSIGPAWNAWIVGLVPEDKRLSFFAVRGRIHELSLLVSVCACGYLLHAYQGNQKVFSVIFFLAFLFRLLSVIAYIKHPTESGEIVYLSASSWRSFVRWIKKTEVMSTIMFIGLLNLGVSIGSPFFTPYLMKNLGYTYEIYMVAIAVPLLSRALAYQVNQKLVFRFGVPKILYTSVVAIASFPALWTAFPSFASILLLQALMGWAWASFEYCFLLKQIYDFKSIERSRILSWTNFIVGVFTVIGVSIGSAILGKTPDFSDYQLVFTTSSVARVLPLVFLLFLYRQWAHVKVRHLFIRLVGLQSGKGTSLGRPILYLDREKDNEVRADKEENGR